ncbi:MAG: methyltransferase domain-containing protein [Egibacteraceae bacterium]
MGNEAEYLLGASDAERARLIAQCEIHRAEAAWLLDRIGVNSGWHALDVGCGPLGVLDLLHERVGPGGEVVGLDREARMLEMARRSIAERDLRTVRLVEAEAQASGLPAASFDLAHARLVLVNVSYPPQVVAEMVRLVRPGGWVALQEVDWISWTCEPPHPAWDQLIAVLTSAWREAGLDVFIGRRLAGMLSAAGLVDVQAKPHAYLWRPGDLYQTLLITFVGIARERILAAGALAEADLDRILAELSAHLAHPGTSVVYALFFQAWGRKPVET